MDTRRLGRTGHLSTLAIFGAVSLWWSEQDMADKALDTVLEYGVNHIDVAPQYGVAQERVGHWLPPHRDTLFLGCKTLERTHEAARADLENSLRVLQTDHVDLYQMHAVATTQTLDEVFAPGGAMELLVEAKAQGKTRFLGLTSHGLQAPAIEMEALRRFDFDTVMFPISPRLYAEPAFRRDAEALLALCQQRDVGVMIIKAASRRPWQEPAERRRDPWYEPYQDYATIVSGVRFVLSQPGVTCAASVGNMDLIPLFLKAAANFTPMSAEDQAALIERRAQEEPESIFVGTQFNTPN